MSLLRVFAGCFQINRSIKRTSKGCSIVLLKGLAHFRISAYDLSFVRGAPMIPSSLNVPPKTFPPAVIGRLQFSPSVQFSQSERTILSFFDSQNHVQPAAARVVNA